jgi:signal transduction histidine kinase
VSHEREVDRMKTEFISTTATHKLRTPLTSIQGFSELLLTRKDLKEKEKEEFVSYINKQSVNLAGIVNDLLDISRLESGRSFLLNKEKCVVGDAIKGLIPYVQGMSSKHKLKVVLPEEPVELLADKDKVEQVLKNLLSNAVKYSPEGGIVCLTAKVIAEYPIAEGRLQNADLKDENQAAINTIENIDLFELDGILLRIDGEINAFGIASRLTENMGVLHFEKAFASKKGLYQYFDRECARRFFKGCSYINKESDMNVPGLAKAKKSYHPVMTVKSYMLTVR